MDSTFTPNANDEAVSTKLRNSMYGFTSMSKPSMLQNEKNRSFHTSRLDGENPVPRERPSMLSTLINNLCNERINPSTLAFAPASLTRSITSPTSFPTVASSYSNQPFYSPYNPKGR